MRIAKGRKPVWKGCVLCDCSPVTFWKRPSQGDSKDQWLQGGAWWSTGDFQGRETLLYDTGMVNTLYIC